MWSVVLSDSLVNEYLDFRFNEQFNREKVGKLLKYILSFPLKSSHPLMQDPSFAPQIHATDPLIEVSSENDDSTLVQMSALKLMLVDTHTNTSFLTLNIMGLNEKLRPEYTARYQASSEKIKAQMHIKALLSDAQWIKITDSYIEANGQWNINKQILADIVPQRAIRLTIVSGSTRVGGSFSSEGKQDLKSICNGWEISSEQYNDNILHDRYIETDRVQIMLSGGLYHLSTSSKKELAYIVSQK